MDLIVAFDASSESKTALESAIRQAKQMGGDVTAIYSVYQAVRTQDAAAGPPVIEGLDEADERSARALETAEQVAEELDFNIETDVAYGDPVEAVVEYAKENDGSAIFVGHREVAARNAAVGSVARGLIGASPIPVTVVN